MNISAEIKANQRMTLTAHLHDKPIVTVSELQQGLADKNLPVMASSTIIEILRGMYYMKRGNGKNTFWEHRFMRFRKYKKPASKA